MPDEGSRKQKGYTTHNKVRLVRGGAEYFTLLEQLIDEARYSIHLQVYIFTEDITGNTIAEALIRAAERKVKVYFIIDGYASPKISDELYVRFEQAGVRFRRFEPLFKNRYFYFGRRLHHKVFVSDGCNAMVAGINISDRYNDLPGQPAWFDVALFVHGDAAHELEAICVEIWNKAYSIIAKAELTSKAHFKERVDIAEHENRASVRVRRNDWVKMKNDVYKSYLHLFNDATQHITIVCSYFLPNKKYRNAMQRALKRGVKIRVVLAGRSDIALAKYAERYLYTWMFNNNIQVYEYEKSVLHAKIATHDGKWMTVGSYNVNDISALASIELNLDVRNKTFVKQTEHTIDKVIANDCIAVNGERYNHAGIIRRFLYFCSYQAVKTMLRAVTSYYTKERN